MSETIKSIQGIEVVHQKGGGYSLNLHSHSYHQFIIPLEKKIMVMTDKAEISVQKGRAIYICKGVKHAFNALSNEHEQIILNISSKKWEASLKAYGLNCVTKDVFLLTMPYAVRASLNLAIILKNNCLSENLLLVFLGVIQEAIISQSLNKKCELQTDISELKKVLDYLNKNFSEGFTVSELSQKFGYSSRNLSRVFKKEFGVTIKEYILNKRIEKAKELVLGGDLKLSEIALDLGFYSLSHFLDTYKKVTGNKL